MIELNAASIPVIDGSTFRTSNFLVKVGYCTTKCCYGIKYGDGTLSTGFFSKETLTLSKDKITGFLFGCGINQKGDFDLEAGTKLNISESVFITPGTIIDSGTVFKYLPPLAYPTFRDAFRAAMTAYPLAPPRPADDLETCYDLSKATTVKVPDISLFFKDGKVVGMPGKSSLVTYTKTQNCCPSVKNILLLDSKGKRVAVRYYSDDWPTNVTKLAFEKNMFIKTMKTNARMEADITILDDNIIVYKFVQDLHFFVTGSVKENELLLSSVLQGFFDAVTLLLRNNVDKREALENLDLIFLCLYEIVDQGIILETDASVIAGKVAIQTMDATGASLAEQPTPEFFFFFMEQLTSEDVRSSSGEPM
ncbi:hypothetical protein LWI29_020415 [Acer saccharum]|uniref:Coatomer subunit zeta n=1 Tax=Acer saccharum TaxID=4024 RepID=A0AA39STE0_ACESA|nr:hypothetical protein LWI29_020415 [Acer saccharum]